MVVSVSARHVDDDRIRIGGGLLTQQAIDRDRSTEMTRHGIWRLEHSPFRTGGDGPKKENGFTEENGGNRGPMSLSGSSGPLQGECLAGPLSA